MLKLLVTCVALAATTAAMTEHAFAFGPAGMGRDLVYSVSATKKSDTQMSKAGFVRPNVPDAIVQLKKDAEVTGSIPTSDHPALPSAILEAILVEAADLLASAHLPSLSQGQP
ncbi:hypothetical protein [Oryzifoliimicrobium ureilyticus]|uniref:hypothetical protein n=1 Tax=Oryzifoliimicrobium ureilyticus TaxID=3113724 RepID=UPI00307633C4